MCVHVRVPSFLLSQIAQLKSRQRTAWSHVFKKFEFTVYQPSKLSALNSYPTYSGSFRVDLLVYQFNAAEAVL